MERNSSSAYCSLREVDVPQAGSPVFDQPTASWFCGRCAACSETSFSHLLRSPPRAPLHLCLETSSSRGLHKAEQSALS